MEGRWRKAHWRWRAPVVVVVAVAVWAWACTGVLAQTRVRLENNGYEGVVVGISPDLEEERGSDLVQAIKNALTEASRELFQATKNRTYFRTVTIVVPREWTKVNLTHRQGSESFQDSDIRVNVKSSTYGDQPYTDHLGGCGLPGRFIHLTPTYLLQENKDYPKGKMLVQEWAKYRWGVFDELGYPNDTKYPSFFYNTSTCHYDPTLCSNQEVAGNYVEADKGYCPFSKGKLGSNCRFDADPRDQPIDSSLMSYLVIKSKEVKYFCDADGHNIIARTKHNHHCNKSVWEVIMDHADFKGGANPPSESSGDPTFRVVQQADATFALVLDYSGSMSFNKRIEKLQRIARRWLLHEVAKGSSVAIIKFNETACLVRGKTNVTDKESRKLLADSVQAKTSGSTSIGAGLNMAVNKVLRNSDNPVIMLISDGKENEHPYINSSIGAVVNSNARVVTVAFGEAADPRLEEVALRTGGKTFTVIDTDDGQMLEDAFLWARTYQPPQPDATVMISDEYYNTRGQEASDTFDVDFTLGKDLTVRLETRTETNISAFISSPVLIGPDGTEHKNFARSDQDATSLFVSVPLAESGQWRWNVTLTGASSISLRARITSRPRNPTVHPIRIKAWANVGPREVDATLEKVIICAEVRQGNNPVVNAEVRAIVTPGHEHGSAHEYILRDNGQFSDNTTGDGIYSGYMTHYTSKGRYIIRAKVTSGNTTVINTSPSTSRRRKRDVQDEKEEQHVDREVCCGSFVPLLPDAPPTGNFQRRESGGSFKVSRVPVGDVLGPARVQDLSVSVDEVWTASSLLTNVSVRISWTAPGDDLDNGIVSGYELRMTDDVKNLKEEKFIVDASSSTSSSSSSSNSSGWSVVDLSGLPWEVEGGTPLLFNLTLTLTNKTYHFALRAWDDQGTVSEVSNTVFLEPDEVDGPSHTDGEKTWVVVVTVVVVAVVVLLCVLVAVLLWRKRRHTSPDRERVI